VHVCICVCVCVGGESDKICFHQYFSAGNVIISHTRIVNGQTVKATDTYITHNRGNQLDLRISNSLDFGFYQLDLFNESLANSYSQNQQFTDSPN